MFWLKLPLELQAGKSSSNFHEIGGTCFTVILNTM
jgi:hypothetical protein